MTQLPRETQKNGDTNKSIGTNEHAKHKPRLNVQQQKRHSAQPGCMNWSWSLCTWKSSQVIGIQSIRAGYDD